MRAMRALLICLVAGLLLAAPATAAAPATETIVVEDSDSIDCGTFQAVQTFRVTIRVKLWFDESEELTKVVADFSWKGTITNSVSGLTLRDYAAWTDLYDGRTGEWQQSGMLWSLTAPGAGMLALDAGSITYHDDGSVTVRGPHEVFEGGDAVICAALS